MNRSDVKIGSYYHIEFFSGWADKIGAYKIVGYVSTDMVAVATSGYDLFKEWFDKYGYSEDKYKAYIDNDTLIYSAVAIDSTDPLLEGQSVYLPSTLIAFDKSYEMVKGYKIKYNLTSSPRIFKTEKARNDFKTTSKKIAIDGLKSTDEFMTDDITVEVDESMVLTTQSEIDKRESLRESIKFENNNALKQIKMNQEMAEKRLFLTALANLESEKDHRAAVENMNRFLNDLKKTQSNLRTQTEVVGKMSDVLIGVIAELMTQDPNIFDGIPGLPANYTSENVYRAIYKSVEAELRNAT